jgi:hypothetical protein
LIAIGSAGKHSFHVLNTRGGQVSFKINGVEALSDESVLKSNSGKALNDDFS